MYRLALGTGRTVGELADGMSAAEWHGWVAFAAIEPFGPVRDDLRAGVVAAALGGGRPSDFFETLKPPPDEAANESGWRACAPCVVVSFDPDAD